MVRKTKAGTFEVDHYWFDADGKRRRKLKTFSTRREAVAYEKEALAQVQKGEFIAPSKVTVEERARSWFEKRFANGAYERATRIERENYVYHYIIPAFGSMPIQELTIERIEKQATEWNKKVSALVVNRVLRTLTNIMAEAKRYGIIKDNPAAEAERLREETKEREIFTAEELRQVIEATEPGSMRAGYHHDAWPHGLQDRRAPGGKLERGRPKGWTVLRSRIVGGSRPRRGDDFQKAQEQEQRAGNPAFPGTDPRASIVAVKMPTVEARFGDSIARRRAHETALRV